MATPSDVRIESLGDPRRLLTSQRVPATGPWEQPIHSPSPSSSYTSLLPKLSDFDASATTYSVSRSIKLYHGLAAEDYQNSNESNKSELKFMFAAPHRTMSVDILFGDVKEKALSTRERPKHTAMIARSGLYT
jgi:hypothetical protein